MPNTNPQLYKVASQQLKVLRTLAKMSAQIGDREGAAIIQAAETAIEHRIQVTRMNLSALEYLENLISQGHDYADAEWRTTQCYSTALVARFAFDSEKLRTDYDSRLMPTTLCRRHQTLLNDIINIADGMDTLVGAASPLENRGSPEFEYAQHKLDLWLAIDSPIPKLSYRFDSNDYRSCRELAAQLLGDCQ